MPLENLRKTCQRGGKQKEKNKRGILGVTEITSCAQPSSSK